MIQSEKDDEPIRNASYYNKVCNYANLRKRSKPIWKAKERSD